MKILFLGHSEKETALIDHLRRKHTVHHTSELIGKELEAWDCVISYGYQHVLKEEHLVLCKRPPINLHISLLPHNRGSYPNFWAWYERTPHGVSIHHIDSGLDTGDVIVQKELFFNEETTLLESYDKLKEELEDLFIKNMDRILSYAYVPKKQTGNGSFHFAKDLPRFEGGWSQTISEIANSISECSSR